MQNVTLNLVTIILLYQQITPTFLLAVNDVTKISKND